MRPTLYVLIAVFNEAENIERLLGNLRDLETQVCDRFSVKVLVVDDGSVDRTADVVRERAGNLNCQVLRHEKNQGPGAAFGTAFEALHGQLTEQDWVATMEGDNTSRKDTLLHMLVRRMEGYDVVLASPFSYGGSFVKTPWWRLALSHIANEMTMSILRLYGLKVLSSFFRLHSGAAIRTLQRRFGPRIVESAGFEWALEMLYKITLCSLKISEVESIVDWSKRKGASKMRTFRTIRGYFKIYWVHRRWKNQAILDGTAISRVEHSETPVTTHD